MIRRLSLWTVAASAVFSSACYDWKIPVATEGPDELGSAGRAADSQDAEPEPDRGGAGVSGGAPTDAGTSQGGISGGWAPTVPGGGGVSGGWPVEPDRGGSGVGGGEPTDAGISQAGASGGEATDAGTSQVGASGGDATDAGISQAGASGGEPTDAGISQAGASGGE